MAIVFGAMATAVAIVACGAELVIPRDDLDGGPGDALAPGDSPGVGEGSVGGDASFKRVFLASVPVTGAQLGDAGFCADRANEARLGPGPWVPWLSFTTAAGGNAKDRVGNGPWHTVTGTLVAKDVNALVNNALSHAIDIDENGHSLPPDGGNRVWTGTAYGVLVDSTNCDDWTPKTVGRGVLGDPTSTNQEWSNSGIPDSCQLPHLVYCFEK